VRRRDRVVAICFLHAFAHGATRSWWPESLASRLHGDQLSSGRAARKDRLAWRHHVMDAYLNPVLRRYVSQLRVALPAAAADSHSAAPGAGGPVRGKDSILSGPAGGVVGFSRVARRPASSGDRLRHGGHEHRRFALRRPYELEFETESRACASSHRMMASRLLRPAALGVLVRRREARRRPAERRRRSRRRLRPRRATHRDGCEPSPTQDCRIGAGALRADDELHAVEPAHRAPPAATVSMAIMVRRRARPTSRLELNCSGRLKRENVGARAPMSKPIARSNRRLSTARKATTPAPGRKEYCPCPRNWSACTRPPAEVRIRSSLRAGQRATG